MEKENSRLNMVTPLPAVAQISRIVTRVVDRLCGDRADYPLLVATACSEALKNWGIGSRVFYGSAAWVEVLENLTPIWAGRWGGAIHFWTVTEFDETVDLNLSVSHRVKSRSPDPVKSLYSPPMIWTKELPNFCQYGPEGLAEIELTDEKHLRLQRLVLDEVREKCKPEAAAPEGDTEDMEFPNEAIICPGRRLLDDSRQSFLHFDRSLSVHGLPQFRPHMH